MTALDPEEIHRFETLLKEDDPDLKVLLSSPALKQYWKDCNEDLLDIVIGNFNGIICYAFQIKQSKKEIFVNCSFILKNCNDFQKNEIIKDSDIVEFVRKFPSNMDNYEERTRKHFFKNFTNIILNSKNELINEFQIEKLFVAILHRIDREYVYQCVLQLLNTKSPSVLQFFSQIKILGILADFMGEPSNTSMNAQVLFINFCNLTSNSEALTYLVRDGLYGKIVEYSISTREEQYLEFVRYFGQYSLFPHKKYNWDPITRKFRECFITIYQIIRESKEWMPEFESMYNIESINIEYSKTLTVQMQNLFILANNYFRDNPTNPACASSLEVISKALIKSELINVDLIRRGHTLDHIANACSLPKNDTWPIILNLHSLYAKYALQVDGISKEAWDKVITQSSASDKGAKSNLILYSIGGISILILLLIIVKILFR